MIDPTNFQDLRALSPNEVVFRTGCCYDASFEQYRIHVWEEEYIVDVKKNKITAQNKTGEEINEYLALFIVFYLIKSKSLPVSGVRVSEKDITGGAAFFRGPHLIPSDRITGLFENDLSAFEERCIALGGKPLDLADKAFEFWITPNIPVAVLYWIGDEDFPSDSKLLFDKTIEQHLPLDIIWALSVLICKKLSAPLIESHGTAPSP